MTQEEVKRKIDELVTERTYLSAKHSSEHESLKKQGIDKSGSLIEMRARLAEINAQLKPLHEQYGSGFHHYAVDYTVHSTDALGNKTAPAEFKGRLMKSTIDCPIGADTSTERLPNYAEIYADIQSQLFSKHDGSTFDILKIVKTD